MSRSILPSLLVLYCGYVSYIHKVCSLNAQKNERLVGKSVYVAAELLQYAAPLHLALAFKAGGQTLALFFA